MALQDLLNLSNSKSQQKIGLSEERIKAIVPQARQYISFWREYPDLFVDFMQTGGRSDVKLTFHLFFYQRVFLRVAMRYKYVYCVFPRACVIMRQRGNKDFLGQTSLIKGTLFSNIVQGILM